MIYITGIRAPYGHISEEQIQMYRWSTSKQNGGSTESKDQFIKNTYRNGQVYSYNPQTETSEKLLLSQDKNKNNFLKTDSNNKETWLDKLPRI